MLKKLKRAYFKPPPASIHYKNGFFHLKSIHNTYFNADKRLRRLGIEFNTIDLDKDGKGDLYVYADAPYPWEIKLWWKIITKQDKNILFGLESPLVNPFSQMPLVHLLFNKVFTWDDYNIDNKKRFKFYVQQTNYKIGIKKVNLKEKKFLTFINNKKDIPWIFIILSSYKENLYKKRIQVLDFFTKTIPADFEFYGKSWNRPIKWSIKERIFGVKKYSTYMGEHKEDKITTLSRYKFCLCFENAVAPGYITEKIFDCFKAGCVPIYWGAPNISAFIDKNCFIDYCNFPSLTELLEHLQNMSEETYNNYLLKIDKFMGQKKVKKTWFRDNFIKTIEHLVNN